MTLINGTGIPTGARLVNGVLVAPAEPSPITRKRKAAKQRRNTLANAIVRQTGAVQFARQRLLPEQIIHERSQQRAAAALDQEIAQRVKSKQQRMTWVRTGWWRAVASDGSLWAESSDEQEIRGLARSGDVVQAHERQTEERWIDAMSDEPIID
jgi:hypothetical protein